MESGLSFEFRNPFKATSEILVAAKGALKIVHRVLNNEPRLPPQVEALVTHPSHAVDVSNGELKDGNVAMEENA